MQRAASGELGPRNRDDIGLEGWHIEAPVITGATDRAGGYTGQDRPARGVKQVQLNPINIRLARVLCAVGVAIAPDPVADRAPCRQNLDIAKATGLLQACRARAVQLFAGGAVAVEVEPAGAAALGAVGIARRTDHLAAIGSGVGARDVGRRAPQALLIVSVVAGVRREVVGHARYGCSPAA